jgi:histidinol dehydrogenase
MLAYGTESVRPVDVIVGPGNAYVAIAKRLVAGEGRVGIPSAFAGPSEVVVIADGSAPTTFAAVDILVQAEHGPDGLAWLISWDEAVLDAVTSEVARLTAAAPRRADLEATFAAGGYAVLVDDPEQAMAVSNVVAPEHLELMVSDPEALLRLVRHAGAVFCGPWSPASVGDYVAGPSHVLPTFGSARFGSALTVGDFTKHVHVVAADEAALRKVGPWVATLATTEGLPAHAASITLRTGS